MNLYELENSEPTQLTNPIQNTITCLHFLYHPNSDVIVTLRYPSTSNVVDALSINAHKDVVIDMAYYGSYNIRNLELESHEQLDLERSPCNSDPNYSFDEVSQ